MNEHNTNECVTLVYENHEQQFNKVEVYEVQSNNSNVSVVGGFDS